MTKQPKSKAELRAELTILMAAYTGPVRRNAPEPINEQGKTKGRPPWWQRRQAPKQAAAT